MSLLGIAIVGKKNEPLYLCDCTKLTDKTVVESTSPEQPQDGGGGDGDDDDDITQNTMTVQDPFGFLLQNDQSSATLPQGQSLEMEQQFILHAALDRIEEQVGASNPDGTMPLRKAVRNNTSNTTIVTTTTTTAAATTTTTASSSSTKSNPRPRQQQLGVPPNGQWLGLLTVQDGSSVVTYGYVTATNIKFIALAEHPTSSSSSSSRELLQRQRHHIRTLCRTLHGHYVSYLMNPFQPLHEKRLQSDTLDRKVRSAVQTYQASITQDDESKKQ